MRWPAREQSRLLAAREKSEPRGLCIDKIASVAHGSAALRIAGLDGIKLAAGAIGVARKCQELNEEQAARGVRRMGTDFLELSFDGFRQTTFLERLDRGHR